MVQKVEPGQLALSAQGIIPPENKMLPEAVVDISVGIYILALLIGFYSFYCEQDAPPSNLTVRDQQVSDLESELNGLGGNQ